VGGAKEFDGERLLDGSGKDRVVFEAADDRNGKKTSISVN
jgi:hypothetical protein